MRDETEVGGGLVVGEEGNGERYDKDGNRPVGGSGRGRWGKT